MLLNRYSSAHNEGVNTTSRYSTVTAALKSNLFVAAPSASRLPAVPGAASNIANCHQLTEEMEAIQ